MTPENSLLYHYILVNQPHKIETTDFLGELIDLLYSGEADFISDGQRINLNLPDNYFDFLRKEIASYEVKVPLYDISFNHIYLIYKENVYPRIHENNYRFTDKAFYESLLEVKNPTDADNENIRILSYYDLDQLIKTYLKIFYQSYVLNSYITTCRKPSFDSRMEHISPYYSINELYYLAYDWDLTDRKTLSESEINRLCQTIVQFDIPAQTLLDHQMYIYDSKAIGLVKYYSLFGSYYMNLYLRKYRCCIEETHDYTSAIRNIDLEKQISLMVNLVKNAPAFQKSHTVYRFVQKDEYFKHIKVGEIYTDPSFMSTTRNPFRYQEHYTFGYILLKIKLPGSVKGVGLSIEGYSNFPKEEEIILPPTSKFRLDRVIDIAEAEKYHHALNKKITKKYEFTLVGNNLSKEFFIDMPGAFYPVPNIIDLKNLLLDERIQDLSISDRLKNFRDTFVRNMNNQFISTIGGQKYTFNFESYDATSVYKPFFYNEVSDGIMITSANPKYGNINILLELGPEIHANYYFKYSVTDSSRLVDLNRLEWIEWLSLLAYIIGSRYVTIHSNYIINYDKNDSIIEKQNKTRYPYSQNIYLYLSEKKKLFEFDEIIPNFDYSQLDLLEVTKISDIIKPTDINELYRVSQNSGLTNMREFYLYIVKTFPKLLNLLEEKMELIYDQPSVNPFLNISYQLDAWMYLQNKKLIGYIPSDKEFRVKKGSFKGLIGDKKIPKFKNRLRAFLTNE